MSDRCPRHPNDRRPFAPHPELVRQALDCIANRLPRLVTTHKVRCNEQSDTHDRAVGILGG